MSTLSVVSKAWKGTNMFNNNITNVGKIAKNLYFKETWHSTQRQVERKISEAKIIESVIANAEDIICFCENNYSYEALMLHDSIREVCFILGFSMCKGNFVASVITNPKYSKHNWCRPNTLFWECKH